MLPCSLLKKPVELTLATGQVKVSSTVPDRFLSNIASVVWKDAGNSDAHQSANGIFHKPLNNGYRKIQIKNNFDHHATVRFLSVNNVQNHTYQIKREREHSVW